MQQIAGWQDMGGSSPEAYSNAGPSEQLRSSKNVRRPLHGHKRLLDVLSLVFRWCPEDRLSAWEALDHSVWESTPTSSEAAPPPPVPTPPLPRPAPAGKEVSPDALPCSCRGACGRTQCHRRRSKLYYLRKTRATETTTLGSFGVFADRLSSPGRCVACMAAAATSPMSTIGRSPVAPKRPAREAAVMTPHKVSRIREEAVPGDIVGVDYFQ